MITQDAKDAISNYIDERLAMEREALLDQIKSVRPQYHETLLALVDGELDNLKSHLDAVSEFVMLL